MSSQNIYGLYGLKHHSLEISGDVTDAGQAGKTNEQKKGDTRWLSFAK